MYLTPLNPGTDAVIAWLQKGTALLLLAVLAACGSADNGTTDAGSPQEAQAYQEKVQQQVNESVVNSLAREWGIPEEKVRCLLADHRASQLARVASDPELQAVFEACGVDPSVVDS